MQDRPTAGELLEIIIETLDEQVLPVVQGAARHPTRVAINLCRIVERELQLGSSVEANQRAAVAEALELTASEDAGDSAALVDQLIARLDDDDPEFERRAWQAAMTISEEKLRVARPGYIDHVEP